MTPRWRRMLAVWASLREYFNGVENRAQTDIFGSHIKGKASHKIVTDGKRIVCNTV